MDIIFHAITIGYRRKGVSPIKGGGDLGLEGSSILDELLSQGLIYCGPSRKLNLWRGFSAKLLMSSRICQTTTLYRLILVSDSPSKQKIKNAK